MKPNNPFLISGYYSPEFFCDREQETVTILDALHNGRNVTLIAPRRMGKTGLIRHAFYRLKEQQPDIVTFYMDIYSTQSLGDFVRLFASTVLGQLDSAHQKALSRISQFIRSCRPVFTFDELTGVPKVTIDVAPAEEENTLKEIFEYMGSSEKRCYVAIDEFQQIAEYSEKGVEALLRSYIQFLPCELHICRQQAASDAGDVHFVKKAVLSKYATSYNRSDATGCVFKLCHRAFYRT